MTGARILHLVPAAEFAAHDPAAPYAPPGLRTAGFIHCTAEPGLLLEVANRFYRAEPGDFLVLVIDPARLTSEVRYELPVHDDAFAQRGLRFPHVYGPIDRAAIVEVRRPRRAEDGTFVEV